MKQQTLFPMKNTFNLFQPTLGRRKIARPLSTKHAIHVILKSSHHNLRNNERAISRYWIKLAKRLGFRTYDLVIHSNHIHASIRIHSRFSYRKFISALTGVLARRFQIKWATSPATRLIAWGRAFKLLRQYIKLNFLEAEGFLDYQPERTRDLPHFVHL